MAKSTRRIATVWAAVGAALCVWLGLGAGIGAGERSKYHDDLRDFQKKEHFWNVVAGQEEARSGVLDKLARDLHDLQTSQQVYRFRGDSNRYGGISDELGYDPFAGENCSECGPLELSFANHVVDAKMGLETFVIGKAPKDPGGSPGPPWAVWPLYVLSLPVALLFYWRRREKKYASMPYEARLMRELDEAMKGLHPGSREYHDLSTLRFDLQRAMDTRVEYGEDEKNTLRIEELKSEVKNSLDAITEGNRALQ